MRDAPAMRAMVPWVSLVSVVALAGCLPDVPPTIFPPPLPRLKIEEEFKAAALTQTLAQKETAAKALFEKGARAILPVFEADGFFVSLPPQLGGDVSPQIVKGGTVDQVLKAVGFDAEKTGLEKIESGQKVFLPQANFTKLAMVACKVLPKEKGEAGTKKKKKGGAVPGLCDMPDLQPNPTLDKLLETSYGVNVEQFKKIIERREVQFIYRQLRKIRESENSPPRCPDLQEKVPIEHMGVFARGRVVAGRLITIAPEVTNKIKICRDKAAEGGKEALERIRGINNARKPERNDVKLLLLPYGETKMQGRRVPALRYVYRMPIVADFRSQKGLFNVWLDAADRSILQLQPLVEAATAPQGVPAAGRAFNRDPDLSPSPEPVAFEVGPAVDGWYTLQLPGAIGRPGRWSDNGPPVRIPDNANESSPTFANFDQPGLNNPNGPGFQEIDLYATISRYLERAVNAGVFMPFPAPWAGNPDGTLQVVFDHPGYPCTGYAPRSDTLLFGVCSSNGRRVTDDHTVVAHEMGHLLTWRQTTEKPEDWCVGTCSKVSPSVPWAFHDFADSWAHAFEDTNCFGGYIGESRDCAKNHEDSWRPRKSEPGSDHFPEHRRMAQGPYADMQIAAAALWAVRQGMLSKDATEGRFFASLLYLKRFMGALRMIGLFNMKPETSGWFGLSTLASAQWFGRTEIGNTDQDIYAGLLDLERQLANQWAGEGLQGDEVSHTMNKVTAGFARAGIFLIPVVCLDGDSSTMDPLRCPEGEGGADAVIDIDDGVASGNPPVFHVWTGPRYVFDGNGMAQLPENGKRAPCNTFFEVEFSDQLDSNGDLAGTVRRSGGIKVEVTPDSAPSRQCYGVWPMDGEQWDDLRKGLKNGDRIYYRAQTWDEGRSNLRISTEPGAGLFVVPPPFAVATIPGSVSAPAAE